jgi:hypothetical protein
MSAAVMAMVRTVVFIVFSSFAFRRAPRAACGHRPNRCLRPEAIPALVESTFAAFELNFPKIRTGAGAAWGYP